MAKPTHYDVLGVSRTATEDEIKGAYRKLAREFHPDVNQSADAEVRFKEINEAYATLSDSLKRADYDQSLGDTGVRRDDGSAAGTSYTGGTAAAASDPNRQAAIRAALARVAVTALIAGLLGALIQAGLLAMTERPLTANAITLGGLPAMVLGALYGADINFKVETFLGTGWLGRTYTLSRTILMSLGLAFYGGLLGAALDRLAAAAGHPMGVGLMVLGLLAGAVAGSDGDTPEKLRSGTGRFNLLYTLLRGAEVGAVCALVGAGIGGILALIGAGNLAGWGGLVGFSIGMIAGSIKPPNLAAYASYASASIKNVMIILMLLAALLAGAGFGITFGEQFRGSLGL